MLRSRKINAVVALSVSAALLGAAVPAQAHGAPARAAAPVGATHAPGAPAGPTDPAKKEVAAAVGPMDVAQTFRNQAGGGYLSIIDKGYGAIVGTEARSDSFWYVHVWNDGTRRLKNVFQLRCISGVGTASRRKS